MFCLARHAGYGHCIRDEETVSTRKSRSFLDKSKSLR
jgi:hypothetical protein